MLKVDFEKYQNVIPLGLSKNKKFYIIFFEPFNSDINKLISRLRKNKIKYTIGNKSLHILTNIKRRGKNGK